MLGVTLFKGSQLLYRRKQLAGNNGYVPYWQSGMGGLAEQANGWPARTGKINCLSLYFYLSRCLNDTSTRVSILLKHS